MRKTEILLLSENFTFFSHKIEKKTKFTLDRKANEISKNIYNRRIMRFSGQRERFLSLIIVKDHREKYECFYFKHTYFISFYK